MDIVTAPESSAPELLRIADGRVRARFGVVVDPGFQPLPDVLLFHQAELGLTSEELNVLLNVTAHWYEPERMPFPRATSIARRMGSSERTVLRHLQSLIVKGFLVKVKGRSATGTPLYRDNQDAISASIRMRMRGWILG
jgi:predicted transcriptional regulator